MYRWISKKALKIIEKTISPRRSRLYMPWHKNTFPQEQHRRMAEIHKLSNRINWTNSSISRKYKLIFSGLIWPVHSFAVALFLVAKYGQAVERDYKIGRARQYFELIYLANRYNIDMDTYYQLRLFQLASRDDAVLYLNRQDARYLLSSLCNNQDMRKIDDKLLFYKNCKEHDLPVAPVYVYFNNLSEEWLEASPGDIPPMDLFIKWNNLGCGIGAQFWKYFPDESVWKRNGTSFDLEGLISYCRERSQSRPVILQPRLTNHRQIAHFSLGGLCTFRVVTCGLPDQEPEIICAGLKMPIGESMVDNLVAGGLVSGIDLQTGTLTTAEFKDIRKGTWDSHPHTNVVLRGQRIQHWQAIVDLCIQAQKSFKGAVSIGWDVAVTADGPILLEANSGWCPILAQKASGNPIGSTSFPSYYIKA